MYTCRYKNPCMKIAKNHTTQMQTKKFMHKINEVWRWIRCNACQFENTNQDMHDNTKPKTHLKTCTRNLCMCGQIYYKVKLLSTQIHKILCTCACAVFDTAVLIGVSRILNLSLGKVAPDSLCKSSAADAVTPQAHAWRRSVATYYKMDPKPHTAESQQI